MMPQKRSPGGIGNISGDKNSVINKCPKMATIFSGYLLHLFPGFKRIVTQCAANVIELVILILHSPFRIVFHQRMQG